MTTPLSNELAMAQFCWLREFLIQYLIDNDAFEWLEKNSYHKISKNSKSNNQQGKYEYSPEIKPFDLKPLLHAVERHFQQKGKKHGIYKEDKECFAKNNQIILNFRNRLFHFDLNLSLTSVDNSDWINLQSAILNIYKLCDKSSPNIRYSKPICILPHIEQASSSFEFPTLIRQISCDFVDSPSQHNFLIQEKLPLQNLIAQKIGNYLLKNFYEIHSSIFVMKYQDFINISPRLTEVYQQYEEFTSGQILWIIYDCNNNNLKDFETNPASKYLFISNSEHSKYHKINRYLPQTSIPSHLLQNASIKKALFLIKHLEGDSGFDAYILQTLYPTAIQQLREENLLCSRQKNSLFLTALLSDSIKTTISNNQINELSVDIAKFIFQYHIKDGSRISDSMIQNWLNYLSETDFNIELWKQISIATLLRENTEKRNEQLITLINMSRKNQNDTPIQPFDKLLELTLSIEKIKDEDIEYLKTELTSLQSELTDRELLLFVQNLFDQIKYASLKKLDQLCSLIVEQLQSFQKYLGESSENDWQLSIIHTQRHYIYTIVIPMLEDWHQFQNEESFKDICEKMSNIYQNNRHILRTKNTYLWNALARFYTHYAYILKLQGKQNFEKIFQKANEAIILKKYFIQNTNQHQKIPIEFVNHFLDPYFIIYSILIENRNKIEQNEKWKKYLPLLEKEINYTIKKTLSEVQLPTLEELETYYKNNNEITHCYSNILSTYSQFGEAGDITTKIFRIVRFLSFTEQTSELFNGFDINERKALCLLARYCVWRSSQKKEKTSDKRFQEYLDKLIPEKINKELNQVLFSKSN